MGMPRTLIMLLWKYGGGEEGVEDASDESRGKALHVGCGLDYELHQSGLDIRVTYVHGEVAPRVATQSSRAYARFEVWVISYLTTPLITLYSPMDIPRTLIKRPWMCGGHREGSKGEGGSRVLQR